MTSQFAQVLCAECHVPPEAVVQSGGEERFACPICGVSDTGENAIREAMEHAKEVAARSLQKSVHDVAQKSKFMKFEGAPIPKGTYRFISDFKL